MLTLSEHLAERYDVEIVSVIRRWKNPFFTFPDGVTIRVADDQTERAGRIGRLLSRVPSILTPPGDASYSAMSLLSDLRTARVLCGPRPDVLIGTRPSLNLLIAEAAPRGVVTIGQDHGNLGRYKPDVRREIARSYGRLTVLAVLTETTRSAYLDVLAGTPVRIVRIPNAVPASGQGPADLDAKVIVAAGRLVRLKGFDLLIRAYEGIAAGHPGWTLKIFGAGQQKAELAALVDELGLGDRVCLAGRTGRLAEEMARASIYALSSRSEGMPMVVIEAMSAGLPVVAFDCPAGPAEMITPGRDGLLIPAEDVKALGHGLATLMEDRELRHRLGAAALGSARAYGLDVVGARWDALLAELLPGAAAPGPPASTREGTCP